MSILFTKLSGFYANEIYRLQLEMGNQHHTQISSLLHPFVFPSHRPSDFTATQCETHTYTLPSQLPLHGKINQNKRGKAWLCMLMAMVLLGIALWVIITNPTFIPQVLFNNNEHTNLHTTTRQLLYNPTLPIIAKDRMPRWYSYQDQQPQPVSSTTHQQQDIIPSQDEILRVVYDNDRQLDYQIVVNITGTKKKLAEKLLSLTQASNYDASLILKFQQQYYEEKYSINHYPQQPMCIIVPTYNNAANQRYKSNLLSIISQQYSNFKAIIIDDYSTDDTATLINDLLNEKGVDRNQYVLVRNDERMMAMRNIRMAARKYCNHDDIMMIIDGDDQLIGNQVFKLFNAVLNKQKVWFAYSNFLDSNKNVGFSRPIPTSATEVRKVRGQLFVTSHLRAFYVSLFLRIKEKDLQDSRGRYFQAANDVAMCIPMLEMSGDRVRYIPEITYSYESNTGNNNHLIRAEEQKSNDREIRRKPEYQPLDTLFSQ